MYYGMFTEAGNIAVTGIVMYHREVKSPWLVVYQNLCDLARTDGFGEATDTMVREMVYDALGFTSDFYV